MRKNITKKEVLEYMKIYYDQHQKPPTTRGFNKYLKGQGVCCNTYRFGSFNDLLKEAQIPINKNSKVNSVDEIISYIKEYYQTYNEVPSINKMKKYLNEKKIRVTLTHPNHPTWNEILKKAGFSPLKQIYSKGQIINYLKEDFNNDGVAPSFNSWYGRTDRPDPGTVVNHFGSWNNGLRIAMIPLNQENDKYTDKELIEIIQDFFKENYRIPYKDELFVDRSVFIRRFGSWRQAIIKAGLMPNSQSSFGAIYCSNHKDIRPSTFEGLVDDYIFNYSQVSHKHDVRYSKYIETERQFTFDFVILDKWFIECAGMLTEKNWRSDSSELDKATQGYKEKLIEKMQIINTAQQTGVFKGNFIVLFRPENHKKLDSFLNNKLSPMIQEIVEEHGGVPLIEKKRGVVVKTSTKMQKYTDEELIEIIKVAEQRLGRRPRLRDMGKNGFPVEKTFTKRCRWSVWLKRAGYFS